MLFIIKKIITPFLLPPGIFILLLMVIGLAGMARRHWRVGFLNLFLGFALYALSITPVANGLVQGLEADFSFPANPTGDVIILLGGGTIQKVPDLTGTAVPTPLMMTRIVTAVRLYRQTNLPIIVTGGRMADDDASEAQVAKRFLMDLGVPEDAIIEEGMARDTAENARFTASICRRKGFSRPIVLTTAYHLKRALIAFNAAGMRVTPFPAYFFGQKERSIEWRDLLPRAAALYLSANALHEYLGIWYYRIME
jgi:uncharacterized SAM-binding protein YcdF (DUF218 family)